MKALLDMDVIVYVIGYVSEEDPVEVAYSRVDEFITNIIIATGATDYQGYLSDSSENNFRYKIDPKYKANRIQPKPKWYNEIKEYLITKHNAKIAYGKEADDLISIEQWKDMSLWFGQPFEIEQSEDTIINYLLSTIAATIDKDIDRGVPGWHYSWPIWRKGEIVREGRVHYVTEDEALRWHYTQLLLGDKSDNIRGIDGLGEKKIAKLFDEVPTEKLVDIVAQEYDVQWGDRWYEEMVKNSKLLWIKRSEEENELTPVERYYQQQAKEASIGEAE